MLSGIGPAVTCWWNLPLFTFIYIFSFRTKLQQLNLNKWIPDYGKYYQWNQYFGLLSSSGIDKKLNVALRKAQSTWGHLLRDTPYCTDKDTSLSSTSCARERKTFFFFQLQETQPARSDCVAVISAVTFLWILLYPLKCTSAMRGYSTTFTGINPPHLVLMPLSSNWPNPCRIWLEGTEIHSSPISRLSIILPTKLKPGMTNRLRLEFRVRET